MHEADHSSAHPNQDSMAEPVMADSWIGESIVGESLAAEKTESVFDENLDKWGGEEALRNLKRQTGRDF